MRVWSLGLPGGRADSFGCFGVQGVEFRGLGLRVEGFRGFGVYLVVCVPWTLHWTLIGPYPASGLASRLLPASPMHQVSRGRGFSTSGFAMLE